MGLRRSLDEVCVRGDERKGAGMGAAYLRGEMS
jgi:hypothetical protein